MNKICLKSVAVLILLSFVTTSCRKEKVDGDIIGRWKIVTEHIEEEFGFQQIVNSFTTNYEQDNYFMEFLRDSTLRNIADTSVTTTTWRMEKKDGKQLILIDGGGFEIKREIRSLSNTKLVLYEEIPDPSSYSVRKFHITTTCRRE